MAQKRADELKAEATANSGKRLMELPSAKKMDFKVLHPPEFTFLTQSRLWIRLNCASWVSVIGLDKVDLPEAHGLPSCEKVFGLAPNQVDVATNRPKTEIYVIRAVDFTSFRAALVGTFIAKCGATGRSPYSVDTPMKCPTRPGRGC